MTGVRLHARVSGPPDAPALVLGSSLGTTGVMWDGCESLLATEHRVIRFDTRGHGRSPVPAGPYSIDDLAADVLVTLDDLGVGEFGYAGLSLGGVIGMWLAANAPQRVTRLSLWCTAAHFRPAQPWHDRAATVRAAGVAAVADAVVQRWFTPGFAAQRPEVVADLRTALAATPAEGYAGCCEAIAVADLRPALPQIAAPTLLVAGADDPVTPVARLDELAKSITDSSVVVLSPAAHLAAVEQPSEAARLLIRHFG